MEPADETAPGPRATSAGPDGARAPTGPPEPPAGPASHGGADGSERPRRRVLLVLAAWLALAAGIGSSLAAGIGWAHYRSASLASSTGDTASAVAAAVGSALQADRDFVASVQSMVVADPGMTNRELSAWLTASDVRNRYPGAVGMTFLEPVAAADLPAFIATIQADPPTGISATPYAIFPAGQRAEYCLTRYGVQYVHTGLPIGTDLCALTAPRLARVRDTGTSDFTTLKTALEEDAIPGSFVSQLMHRLGDVFEIVSPAYTTSAAPLRTAARAGTFAGWMLSTFSIPALLHAGVQGTTAVRVALRYQLGSGPWHSIGAAGTAPGPTLAVTRTVDTGPALDVRIQAVVTSSVNADPWLAGLVVALAGAAVSILVFAFLMYLASSRRRALHLVEERTRALRHQALHDALTDLPNRALLFDRAQQMLFRARREPMAFGALYVDLDNFKEINDTFGHHAGDELLRAVATRFQTVLRASDTVGRLGGDEFLVLVEGDLLDAGPELVAERLLAVLIEPFRLDTPEHPLVSMRASIGAAVGMRRTADELIRDADIALYAAKAAGRNRVVVFRPEMQTAVEDRLALEMDLQHAVEAGELFVLYQPIVDLGTMAPKGAEALVRWHHPTRGVLGPEVFIPLAEETGLVEPIGRFVLDEACRQLAAWRAEGLDIGVAVNVSPRQLESGRVVDAVRHALDLHQVPPSSLTLELTETTLMADTDRTVATLTSLKELGVRISVDDFGTGYSSLAYLRKFPVDTLKIDRSFITRLDETAASGPLVRSVVELGRALGIETLAEGIEDRSQLAWLQREHCDSGQGYLFGQPITAAELESRTIEQARGRPETHEQGAA